MTATDADLEALLAKWDRYIYKLSHRIARVAGIDVEDARQELLLRVAECHPNYDSRYSFVNWLWLMRSNVLDKLMTRRRQVKDHGFGRGGIRNRLGDGPDRDPVIPDHRTPDPADQAARNELAALWSKRVRAALAALTPLQRSCVTRMYGLDGRGDSIGGYDRLTHHEKSHHLPNALDRLREVL